MKKLLRARPIWLIVLSPILAALSLLSYFLAVANAQKSSASFPNSNGTAPDVPCVFPTSAQANPSDDDEDPEHVAARQQYLDWLFGNRPGGFTAEKYNKALAAGRALGPSPLLRGQKFAPLDGITPRVPTTASWTYPIPPPMNTAQGGGGYGGIASSRLVTLCPHPTNNNVVYTGSAAGLAKTEDAGVHWQYLSNAWDTQEVNSIAIDPNAANYIYVGTGNAHAAYGRGVYRSFDGGAHWTNLGLSRFQGSVINKIVIDPKGSGSKSHTTVYAANAGRVDSGLWRSTDSGATWPDPPVLSVPGDGVYDFVIDSLTSTLYLTKSDGTFRSTDDGGTWEPIHAALINGPNHLKLVNSTLYLIGPGDSAHNLFKSDDQGDHWTQIPTVCPTIGQDTPCFLGFGVFDVDPADQNIIVAGGFALYRTVDEGLNWTEVPSPIHVDHRVIGFSPNGSGLVYDGNDGGIVSSTDHGATWANLNQNFAGVQLYGIGLSRDGSMIGGTQDCGIVLSSHGGIWTMIWGGDSAQNAIDPTDGELAYFTMYWARYFMKYDHGQYINIRPTLLTTEPCNFFPAFSMNLKSPQHLLAACQHVMQTLDGGTTWTQIGGALLGDCDLDHCAWYNSVTAAAEAPSDRNVIYAISCAHRNLWVTVEANKGPYAKWENAWENLPWGLNAVTVHPDNPEIAYVAHEIGIYRTTDSGKNWSLLPVPENGWYRDVAIDPNNPAHVFASSNVSVYASTDGGDTWNDIGDGIPKGMVISDLAFHKITRQLAAGTYGRGAYLLNLDDEPPTAVVNFPANGAHVRGIVNVLGTALDNHRVSSFQFKLDGVNLAGGGGGDVPDIPSPNVSVSWNTTASTNGNHVLTLVVTDAIGLTTTSVPVMVTVDNLPPTVSIIEPENGKVVSGKVTVAADAFDNNGVAGVQFYVDRATLGEEITSAPFSLDWDTSDLRNGDYTLIAVARDAAGNTTTSNAVTVKVVN